MFIVIVVQNLTQKEKYYICEGCYGNYIYLEVWGQPVQVRGIHAFYVTFVSIDQENNLANCILKLQRRTLSLVNEQCKIIYIIAICY